MRSPVATQGKTTAIASVTIGLARRVIRDRLRSRAVQVALGAMFALACLSASPLASTRANFVAMITNPGNSFGVPSVLAPQVAVTTPGAGGVIRLSWTEPRSIGTVTPAATSWAGWYLIYRSESPATPGPNATPYATVVSNASGIGSFVDGPVVPTVSPCPASGPCTRDNVRYFYWVRAVSRQTGFASPLLSVGTDAAADATGPEVVSYSPASDAKVPTTTKVTVAFNEPVDFASATASFCLAPSSTPTQCVAVTPNESRWVQSAGVLFEVKPVNRLVSSTYTVTLRNGTNAVTDIAGNRMATSTFTAQGTSSFSTEVPANTVPIRWQTPALDGQEYMPATGAVVAIAFAEPMDKPSVEAAFSLANLPECGSGSVPFTAKWNVTENAVVFAPTTALSVGLKPAVGQVLFPGVFQYAFRLASTARSGAGNPTIQLECANGRFTPTSSVLAFGISDALNVTAPNGPHVVPGETLPLRSVSGPWRQGSYTSLRALFDEPKTDGVASATTTIGGDDWSGLALTVPADALSGTHFVSVQNEAVSVGIGQDARTAVLPVIVDQPTISVTSADAQDPWTPRTVLSPLAGDEVVQIAATVTAPSRDGSGTRPIPNAVVTIRAIVNPTFYGAVLCSTASCSSSTNGTLQTVTDPNGVARAYLKAPRAGAPFSTIVVLAQSTTGVGSVLLTDPAPIPPGNLSFNPANSRFTWSPSPSLALGGYRVVLSPVTGGAIAPEIVIDAGTETGSATPPGALVPGVAYSGVVVAYDLGGRVSASSAAIQFTAPASTVTPTRTTVATATFSATPVASPTPTAVTTATPTSVTSATPTASATVAPTATPVSQTTGAPTTGTTPVPTRTPDPYSSTVATPQPDRSAPTTTATAYPTRSATANATRTTTPIGASPTVIPVTPTMTGTTATAVSSATSAPATVASSTPVPPPASEASCNQGRSGGHECPPISTSVAIPTIVSTAPPTGLRQNNGTEEGVS